MRAKLTLATFLACLFARALTTALTKTNQQMRIDRVARGKVWRSGPVATLKTYQKYGVIPPKGVVALAATAEVNKTSVRANPEAYDTDYLSPVYVGGSKIPLYVIFDTGSYDFWVLSSLEPPSQTTGHTVYNTSTGSLKSGETWSITYADGSGASGTVYADKVVIGKATATRQAVQAAATTSGSIFFNSNADGILGLSFQSASACRPAPCKSPFDTLAHTLAKPIFTAALKHAAPGSFTFGYIDKSLYSGPIRYVPVDNSLSFWGFSPGGYSIGTGIPTSGNVSSPYKSIIDTGTSLLYLPSNVVAAYYSQVSGSSNDEGGFQFPCNATLPDFNINIGGSVFTIPGININDGPAGNSNCYGGIQSSNDMELNIFGLTFIKSVYIVFEPSNKGGPQIGFAKQKKRA